MPHNTTLQISGLQVPLEHLLDFRALLFAFFFVFFLFVCLTEGRVQRTIKFSFLVGKF